MTHLNHGPQGLDKMLKKWYTLLKNYKNKARLNALICEQLLSDQDCLDSATQQHVLVVTGDNTVPTQVYKGQTTSRADITSTPNYQYQRNGIEAYTYKQIKESIKKKK